MMDVLPITDQLFAKFLNKPKINQNKKIKITADKRRFE
jgi:hypothetical protein